MARFNSMLAKALLVLVSCAALAQSANAVLVYNFNQCGGTGGLCKNIPGLKCVNAQYPGYRCGSKVAHCQKVTAAYWQCRHDVPGKAHPSIKPAPLVIPAGQLAPFAQCGGKGGHCKTAGTCVDAIWSKAVCAAGAAGRKYECYRQNPFLWQCDTKPFPKNG